MHQGTSIKNWFNHCLAAAALACAACGPSGPEAVMTPTPDIRTVPFPSDALLGDDGKVQVAFPFPFDASVDDNLRTLAATLSEADGFSNTRSVFFPVSDDVVVDDGATATVVDLDDPSKTWAFPLFYRAETRQLAAMSPLGTTLREHHAYGCYITAGVHDAAGHALHPSGAMSDALSGHGTVGKKASYQKLAHLLSSMKIAPLAATAFTTQTLTDWVDKVLADLAAAPPKATFTRLFATPAELDALFGGPATTTDPGKPPTGGVLHSAIAYVVEGTYDVPHYLSPTPGTLGTFDPGLPIKATDHVPFILTLPARSDYANTPVLIFQHGINSDRSAVLLVANSYAARGYATLGIDELWHGSRTPKAVDKIYNLSGDPGSDGIGDPGANPVQYFFDFNGDSNAGIAPVDPRYIRDNFRQAAVDLMQEVRLAKGGDWSDVAAQAPALASLTLDGTHLVYTGESFGSILGAIVIAVDPMLDAAVLDVGGGGLLLDLVPNSPSFAQLLQPFVAGAFDQLVDVDHPDEMPTRAQMSLNLVQEVLEPGDGLALAGTADPSKNVLFLDDYADEVVPNQSEEGLAAGWGATQVTTANLSHALMSLTLPTAPAPYMATPLHAIVMLDPSTHGQITLQTGEKRFMPPFPPFTRLATPIPVNNPIKVVHALTLDFADGVRAGAPVVSDPTR